MIDLLAALLTTVLLIHLCVALISAMREKRKYRRRVVATVEQVQVWIEGWYVIAVWKDAVNGQSYTFRSPRIQESLKQRIGDLVVVDYDPDDPRRYRMRV